MDRLHWRWMWLNAIAATAVINVLANGAIAWISVRGMNEVPVWDVPLIGGTSTVVDTIGTIFILPFLTMILTTLAIRREIARGAFGTVALADDPAPFIRQLPQPLLRRALTFAGICTVALGPLALLVLLALDPGAISTSAFIAYKVVLGVALGAVVTPLVAVGAMADR